jgi:hypothetical protein
LNLLVVIPRKRFDRCPSSEIDELRGLVARSSAQAESASRRQS